MRLGPVFLAFPPRLSSFISVNFPCFLSVSLCLSLSLSLYFLFGFLPGALFLTRFPGEPGFSAPFATLCFRFFPFAPFLSAPEAFLFFPSPSTLPPLLSRSSSLSSTSFYDLPFRFVCSFCFARRTLFIFNAPDFPLCSPLNFLQNRWSNFFLARPSHRVRCCLVSSRFTHDFDSIYT